MLFSKVSNFLSRLLLGEDVVLVRQTKGQWERQYADGAWDRLKEGQPNTIELARLISEYARTRGMPVRVLDVGCGNGGLAHLIADKVDYTGIDISTLAIASARKVAPRGTFIACDAMSSNKNLGVFDAIVFNELLYYLDPRTLLPYYRTHADSNTLVYISVVRFWRSWFIWKRIRSVLRIGRLVTVRHPISGQCWDIAIGHFNRAS